MHNQEENSEFLSYTMEVDSIAPVFPLLLPSKSIDPSFIALEDPSEPYVFLNASFTEFKGYNNY